MQSGQYDPLGETFPPLTENEAAIESNRCLFCYDAPCIQACPTHIDIPRFIKKISSGNLLGSARTILESNILGATCARVCPVQELCEGACVLGSEHRPIAIGRLQRHAMDSSAGKELNLLTKLPSTGKSIAVIGAGPAGLSCAGTLARLGHAVTVFEKRELPGGLSTYGIISLREPTEVAVGEAHMIEKMGVSFNFGKEIEAIEEIQAKFDAVFISVGLGASPSLGIPGDEYILDGLSYIEDSKLNREGMQVGRNVVVIGAGNTAIDCATVARRLGAETVTIVYRRTENDMAAYPHEYEFIKNEGVRFQFCTQPTSLTIQDGLTCGLNCVQVDAQLLPIKGSDFTLRTDQVVKAIGQKKPPLAEKLRLRKLNGFVAVTDQFETSTPGLFAGGDCIRATGASSTVMAVQDGKLAASAIDRRLRGEN